jgi:hypothetical protein
MSPSTVAETIRLPQSLQNLSGQRAMINEGPGVPDPETPYGWPSTGLKLPKTPSGSLSSQGASRLDGLFLRLPNPFSK